VAYLYSLYDALVSISVPADKARAVVDAMERDMGATLATKQDIESLRQDMKQDIESLRHETRQEFALVRQETRQEFALVRQELAGVESKLTHAIDTQSLRMTIRLGSMLFLGLGLTIAVLRLWSS
jgi:arginine/ornithine N-succinyltransferase beta subunit